MKLATAAQMRELDRKAIEERKIPSVELMETAAGWVAEAVRELLQRVLSGDAVLTAALTSQIISNVPAAVLLSGFTENWQALVEGTNIGGLGTPIASLASLITLKLYLRAPGAEAGRFLRVFMLVNLAGLAVLLGTAYLL